MSLEPENWKQHSKTSGEFLFPLFQIWTIVVNSGLNYRSRSDDKIFQIVHLQEKFMVLLFSLLVTSQPIICLVNCIPLNQYSY